ncbi:hypothetical protein SADUNF_Sadunf09G0073500 [Salix dunnii]|uniref:Uncharacterized protein n=1 Tax=Salix dunnii TaxID=1413687 RepID=A0A835JXJ3_9ROSI|nr:hypothetical protein SADUNF_Sadunf09G0073500 [Salix dunnii]
MYHWPPFTTRCSKRTYSSTGFDRTSLRLTLDLQAFNLDSQPCNILVIISFCTCVASHTARTMISKTKMLMLRKTRPALQCHFSSPPAVHHPEKPRNNKDSKMEDWVPHPRSGIFVPKGREWVVDDVPEKAASLNQTYWLRNVDGVERPDPDNPDTPPHHPCLSTNL